MHMRHIKSDRFNARRVGGAERCAQNPAVVLAEKLNENSNRRCLK